MNEMLEKNMFEIGDRFGRSFIMISLIYFVIGTLWMVLAVLLPGPSGLAGSMYDTGHWHVVFVGFVAFFLIGIAYYIAPRLGSRPLYSKRLGTIHFWATNILLPVEVSLYIPITFVYQAVINSPTFPSNLSGGLLALEFLMLIIFFVGISMQGLLAYNIFMTMRGNPVP